MLAPDPKSMQKIGYAAAKQNDSYSACIVLVDKQLLVHHLHTKTISMKRGANLVLYQKLSQHSMNISYRLFPSWSTGIGGSKKEGMVKSLIVE